MDLFLFDKSEDVSATNHELHRTKKSVIRLSFVSGKEQSHILGKKRCKEAIDLKGT